jgi:hypothetical protein
MLKNVAARNGEMWIRFLRGVDASRARIRRSFGGVMNDLVRPACVRADGT